MCTGHAHELRLATSTCALHATDGFYTFGTDDAATFLAQLLEALKHESHFYTTLQSQLHLEKAAGMPLSPLLP